MTKNKAMRLGSVMLVLALLTTCAISGTFAKYTAENTAKDDARVAYWGFSSAADATELALFPTQSNTAMTDAGDGYTAIVAPGTDCSPIDLKFEYTNYKTDKITAPEVAYTFAIDVTDEDGTAAFLDGADGFNWILIVGDKETTYAKFADLKSAIEGLGSGSDAIEAGNLPDAVKKTIKIGWKWEFTDTTDAATRDAQDTELGNAQDLDGIKLQIKATATQVD